MSIPSTTTITQRPEFDTPFSQFADAPALLGYVGLRVLTPVEVMTQRGSFYVRRTKEKLRQGFLRRNPDGSYNRVNRKFHDHSFETHELGLEARLDLRRLNMYPDYATAEADTVQDLWDDIAREIEVETTTLLQDTGVFTNAAVAASWKSAPTTANPVADINKAINSIRATSGLFGPIVVVVGFEAYLNLLAVDKFVDRIKFWGGTDPHMGTMKQNLRGIALALGVEEVVVSGLVFDSADYGQAQANPLANFWDPSKVGVYVKAPAGRAAMKQPCVGRTFIWTGDGASINGEEPQLAIEDYMEDQTRGHVFRARFELDPDVMLPTAGYILTGANA